MEPTNEQRAAWGEGLINTVFTMTGEDDPETALIDALANLQHWAKQECVDFSRAYAIAQTHFNEEKEKTPDMLVHVRRSTSSD